MARPSRRSASRRRAPHTRATVLAGTVAAVALSAAGCAPGGGDPTSTGGRGTDPPSTTGSSAPPDTPAPTDTPAPSDTPAPTDIPGASPNPGLPPYSARIRRIGPPTADRMRASHRPGCPVRLTELRLLELSHVGFDGTARRGELVVHRDVAADVVAVFRRLYQARFPVRRMRLVDEYGGDDDRSMAADNTSAYNCRRVAGTDRWSEHAYGRAVDVNPRENPYVQGASVAPPQGRRYAGLDRSPGAAVPPGVVRRDDVVVRAFRAVGWGWGGDWSGSKDWQHFSAGGS